LDDHRGRAANGVPWPRQGRFAADAQAAAEQTARRRDCVVRAGQSISDARSRARGSSRPTRTTPPRLAARRRSQGSAGEVRTVARAKTRALQDRLAIEAGTRSGNRLRSIWRSPSAEAGRSFWRSAASGWRPGTVGERRRRSQTAAQSAASWSWRSGLARTHGFWPARRGLEGARRSRPSQTGARRRRAGRTGSRCGRGRTRASWARARRGTSARSRFRAWTWRCLGASGWPWDS
jgi:hypothetical protein